MIEYIKFNCKDVQFNDKTLQIKLDTDEVLDYPSVEEVLGDNGNTEDLVKNSRYLIH
jgi:hypothetical protein